MGLLIGTAMAAQRGGLFLIRAPGPLFLGPQQLPYKNKGSKALADLIYDLEPGDFRRLSDRESQSGERVC
jgi:hypothetical protein